ncbi:MAG: DUF2892 domain-containing protein [Azospirillum sp.]|nr:DUF2892 domain-containing protein [Azospirillum sp.]
MERNIGTVDVVIRLIVGAVMLAYALGGLISGLDGYLPGAEGIGAWHWLGWLGVVPIATALAGNCPAYKILGISTCTVYPKGT